MPDQLSHADDAQFDAALIAAAFDQAALLGWGQVSVAAAAGPRAYRSTEPGHVFPGRTAVLLRFGLLADRAALSAPSTEASERERLFDLLMRRFDAMQPHREGILALARALPFDPGTAALLLLANLRSMGWMLEAAGIPSGGLQGAVRAKGLLGVWLSAVRAWERDGSADLSGTMAALDKALSQAERLAGWLGLARGPAQDAASVFEEAGSPIAAADIAPGEDPLPTQAGAMGADPASLPPPPPAAEPPASPAV